MIPPEFTPNVAAHTLAEMAPYIDHYIAWSVDGKKILAQAKDTEALLREAKRLGLNGGDFVIDYIPDPDISYLGGVSLQ